MSACSVAECTCSGWMGLAFRCPAGAHACMYGILLLATSALYLS
jgi:hypothetical protein